MQALEDSVATVIVRASPEFAPLLKFRERLHACVRLTPEPCQNVRREDRDSSTGSDACQSPLRARFPMCELVPANHDCNREDLFRSHCG